MIGDADSPVPSKGGRSLPSYCWPHYSDANQDSFLATWAHAGSCSAAVDQNPHVLILSHFLATLSPACSAAWVIVTEMQDLALGLVKLHSFGLSPIDPVCPDLSLCRAFLPSSRSTLPPNLVFHGLTEDVLNPLILIVDKDIQQD